MARFTILVADDVLQAAELRYLARPEAVGLSVNRSAMVTEALRMYAQTPVRADVSGRGRLETLRAVRAAREALKDVERTLTQRRPVKRGVRRLH